MARKRLPMRKYEPLLQRIYAELGQHYGTAIVPARPYKPKGKAKVEVGVQVAKRWILERLRNETTSWNGLKLLGLLPPL